MLDWTMNLWDFKRFRLNDPALAHVYKSQGTLAKLVSTAGPEIHRETGSASGREHGWRRGMSPVDSPRELSQPHSEDPAGRLSADTALLLQGQSRELGTLPNKVRCHFPFQ